MPDPLLLESLQGVLLMDGISMRLQAICEKMKRIEKKSPGIFESVGYNAQPVIRFRDFISHHYDEADFEVLFDICKNHLPPLKNAVLTLRKSLL